MGRGLPPMTLAILAMIVVAQLAYMAASLDSRAWAQFSFAVYPIRFTESGPASFTHWYEPLGPLLGHPFLHGFYNPDNGERPGAWIHLFMNALAFVQAAPIVEWRVGARRLLVIFAVSAIAGAGLYVLLNAGSAVGAVGASGAVCGIFAGYFLGVGRHWREAIHRPEIRNGAIVFLVVNVGLAAIARMTGVLPIAWEAHLGGFIGGAAAYLALAPRRAFGPWDLPRRD